MLVFYKIRFWIRAPWCSQRKWSCRNCNCTAADRAVFLERKPLADTSTVEVMVARESYNVVAFKEFIHTDGAGCGFWSEKGARTGTGAGDGRLPGILVASYKGIHKTTRVTNTDYPALTAGIQIIVYIYRKLKVKNCNYYYFII